MATMLRPRPAPAPVRRAPLCWRRVCSRILQSHVDRGDQQPEPGHRHRPDPGPAGDISLGRRLKGFVALTKPRIVELLLVTTVPTMIVAARGLPPWSLMAATVVGGTLAAGGANALNMVVDRDIDAVMHRTRGRPLVTGVISPAAALVFAIALELVAFGELWAAVNLLSAVLAVSATLFYVFVYTIWLKRTSRQNIVIGGAAGAVPVLVGWAAVRGSLGWAPVVLFALIFVWTPPHFWALAIRYRDDYRSAQRADDAGRHRLQEHGRPDLRLLPARAGDLAAVCLGCRGWGPSTGSAPSCWGSSSAPSPSGCGASRAKPRPCASFSGRSPT